MKKLFEDIWFEILYWIGLFVSCLMIGNFRLLTMMSKDEKKMLKTIAKVRSKSKTVDEYYEGVIKEYPDMKEGIEEMKALRKALEEEFPTEM